MVKDLPYCCHKLYLTGFVMLLLIVFFSGCLDEPDKAEYPGDDADVLWRNHMDTVHYVGIEACKACHPENYNHFIKHGMGRSFARAQPENSAARLTASSRLYDARFELSYHPYWEGNKFYLKEYRSRDSRRPHSRLEVVDYIVGSGHHTNSHILDFNSYLFQAPFTYYTQQGILDFPPGFERGHNSRFSRKIEMGCMSCHNAMPKVILGSENKYESVALGIDCERCHGPGSLHLYEKMMGRVVDTSLMPDNSIVNPARLPAARMMDICARCHVQGTPVTHNDFSHLDFRPGMKLSNFMDIYLPRYTGGKDDFIMASHTDRFQQSACYLAAGSEQFNCLTCHDPHKSSQGLNPDVFNQVCLSCHNHINENAHFSPEQEYSNCIRCHMPETKTADIPHVTIHDHNIGVFPRDSAGLKKFVKMEAVNNPNPTKLSKAEAYMMEYETYTSEELLLDSAAHLLSKYDPMIDEMAFHAYVHLFFLQNETGALLDLVDKLGSEKFDSWVNRMQYSNKDAWTAYRSGQAYSSSGKHQKASFYYGRAVALAPFVPEFRYKWASSLILENKIDEAVKELKWLIGENPLFPDAYVGLGYAYLLLGNKEAAKSHYETALQLNPVHEQALLNMAGWHLVDGELKMAVQYLEEVLKYYPGNARVIQILKQLRAQESAN